MSERREPWVPRVLAWVAGGGAVVFLVALFVLGVLRVAHPFELDWMEGATVDHVRRIASGQRIYVPPSLDFVPFLYTPLYYWVSAAVAQVTGMGFLALRLVSFLASLGCIALIGRLVQSRTDSVFAGLLAAGLFAGTYRMGGAYLDLARVDALFLFLLLCALHVLSRPPSAATGAVAGLLLALAFLTKQAALLVAVPLALGVWLTHRRQGWVLAATLLAVAGGSSLALDVLHDGWFSHYVFVLPGQHGVIPRRLLSFWSPDLLPTLSIAAALAVWHLASGSGRDRLLLASAAVGMFAASWSGRLHPGGYLNVLLPALAIVAILFGLGFHGARERLRRAAGRDAWAALAALHAACLVQFAGLAYDPRTQVPRSADVAAGRSLVELLSSIEGDVFVPCHGHLAALAGKRPHAHAMAMSDLLRAEDPRIGAGLDREIREALASARFGAIVVDEPWYLDAIEQRYRQARPIFADPQSFRTLTGKIVRPEWLYVPKETGQ